MDNNLTYDIENMQRNAAIVPTKKESSNNETCLVCFGGMTIFSLAIGLIAAVIAYYYFGIKYLVDYKDINSECHSHIWDYVLTAIICSFVLGGGQASSTKNDETSIGQKVCSNIIIAMIWTGISTWGIIETHNETCQPIRDTPLWTFAHVVSIIQMVVGGLTFLSSCCICFLCGSKD